MEKVLMAGGADIKMRRLGSLVEALEESPPSLILEGEGDSTLQDNKNKPTSTATKTANIEFQELTRETVQV
ncbi:unnamed protein product [Sphagnum jensenii]